MFKTLTILISLSLLIIVSIIHFLQLYFIQYPTYAADFWGWQYGPREIVRYFEANKERYDRLYMIGEFNAPHIFLYFYSPTRCQKCDVGVPHEYLNSGKKLLFAVTPIYLTQHPEVDLHIKHTIYYPNRSVAFKIGEIVE